MEQKSVHRFIYKIESKRLKKAKWELNLPLNLAMKTCPEVIVSLNDSQCLRFIDEINGVKNINEQVRNIQKRIRIEKKKPKSKETKVFIRNYYEKLYELQFQKDYVCVIMNSESDYDRANLGFSINYGDCIIKYRRFLGTNGGIKNSTIVYVNEEIYPELKKRLDNGRDKEKELVPAKLEAYQALICSGSIPLPEPKGIIVVDDCITRFKEDVILINDAADGEPLLTYEKDYEIEHNDSDGFGLMLPSYARRVNEFLTGSEEVISGMNTRYAWNKGMLYTFDFVEFAETIANTYEVTDIWGDKRDVRDAEVILTASMLKLWDSYKSWEDYYSHCEENHYQFSTPKITPEELENVRDTNYQFLQSYEFSDEELMELCQPTIDEIRDVIGLDYRKSLTFLAGFSLNEDNAFNDNLEYYVRALMIDQRMINDPFIRKKIYNMIKKRIEMGERGAIRVNANFAMISGDPYSLAQNMFGLEVTGLLKKGEVYHKYWLDKGADEIACFRAPMTCHNNIRKMKLAKGEDVLHWYQYITTALIFNSWDSACEAMNGADKDGDTNMCTDNPIIVNRTKNSPTIICLQKKAEKKVPTEEDIIASNKLAFNDDIGVVTNHVTSMIEVQSGYEPGTPEYETLAYRIMCGQLYQQNTIDRAKGIIAKPMPSYWYAQHECKVSDDDDKVTAKQKEFNYKIAAAKKPYFMTYVYPKLKRQNRLYIENNKSGLLSRFNEYGVSSIEDLENFENKTQAMVDYLSYYYRKMPVGNNPCVVNRISWIFENAFKNKLLSPPRVRFDYSILKSGVEYSKANYSKISTLYREYTKQVEKCCIRNWSLSPNDDDFWNEKETLRKLFQEECFKICSNEDELCDILIDLCYSKDKSKQFAWDMCGERIVSNLLKRNNNKLRYPQIVSSDGEFTYCGKQFIMCEKEVEVNEDDYS